MMPLLPELPVAPPPRLNPPLLLGSGKFVIPCDRIHWAYLRAFAWFCGFCAGMFPVPA